MRGTAAIRRRVRRLVRPLYERRWREDDLVGTAHVDAYAVQTLYYRGKHGEARRVPKQNKREELADALFNQAYSCFMAMAMWRGDGTRS